MHLKVCTCVSKVAFRSPKDLLKSQSKEVLAYIFIPRKGNGSLCFRKRELPRYSFCFTPTHSSSLLFCFIFERGINQVQSKLITDPVRTDLLKVCPVKELQGMSSGGCQGRQEGRGTLTTPYRHIVIGCWWVASTYPGFPPSSHQDLTCTENILSYFSQNILITVWILKTHTG